MLIKAIKFCYNSQTRSVFSLNKLVDDNWYYNLKLKSEKNTTINRNANEKQINTTSNRSQQTSEQYCMDCVKKYDYENYLTTLLIKNSSVRRNAFAIRAFNVEMSQIRDLTSTQTIARMRFQFWSDLIDQIFKSDPQISVSNQPIAREILNCLKYTKLSKHWFKKLIDVRADDINLSNFPFRALRDLELYSESTISPVYYLINESLLSSIENESMNANERISLDHIANHVGIGQGITNMLRGISHNIKYGRCYVPTELLIKHNTSHEHIMRCKETQAIQELCFEIASLANQHIEKARSLLKQIKKHQRFLFLPLLTNQLYLSRLQKCDFNIFDPKLGKRSGFLPLYLWFKSKFL